MTLKKEPKYIIVTGGVLSGLGKGVITASIGALFNMMNLKCSIKKLDPYLNIDPGTLNPIEHGEVFVTDDGSETDLDVGYYERFTNMQATKLNSTSSGKIMQTLLERERKGDFLGKTLQMIPHFSNEIKNFITQNSDDCDVILCEIGGSVGDIEAMAFYEALRQLKIEVGVENFVLVHLTYIVYYTATNEFKTKPTQNSLKELARTGLIPDVLVCRHEKNKLCKSVYNKLSLFSNHIIDIPNVDSIYKIPLMLFHQNLHIFLKHSFNLQNEINTVNWLHLNNAMIETSSSNTKPIVIGIVGKYVELHDAYCSLLEAIFHASIFLKRKVVYKWIDCRLLELKTGDISDDNEYLLLKRYIDQVDSVIIPGGFGSTGIETIIKCIYLARNANKPTFGICLGMQLMVVEWLRNVVGVNNATSEECITTDDQKIVVGILPNQDKNILGGTMRLGLYDISISSNTKVHEIYGTNTVKERHRHRYEVLPEYLSVLEDSGLVVSGDRNGLIEIIECKQHKWYVGCQFHPEFISSPFKPHPLILDWLGKS